MEVMSNLKQSVHRYEGSKNNENIGIVDKISHKKSLYLGSSSTSFEVVSNLLLWY